MPLAMATAGIKKKKKTAGATVKKKKGKSSLFTFYDSFYLLLLSPFICDSGLEASQMLPNQTELMKL